MSKSRSKVLLTRDEYANHKLLDHLQREGFDGLSWPTQKFESMPLSLDQTKITEQKFDWLVFTSAQAARAFFLASFYKNLVHPLPPIAVVGEATREAVREHGQVVALEPEKTSALGLTGDPVFAESRGLKILWPCAEDARQELVTAWQGKHYLTPFILYRKVVILKSHEDFILLQQSGVEWVMFYSPSAVRAFVAGLNDTGAAGDFLKSKKLAVIGATTAEFLKSQGLKPAVVAQGASTADLISRMLSFDNSL